MACGQRNKYFCLFLHLVYVGPALILAISLKGMHVEAVFTAQININGIFSSLQRRRLGRQTVPRLKGVSEGRLRAGHHRDRHGGPAKCAFLKSKPLTSSFGIWKCRLN